MGEANASEKENKQGYKVAFNATVLFGGVQIVTIILGILKSKVVALWLGAAGYGILSIFNSTTSLISYITNLGLQSSAVRDIANAHGKNDIRLVSGIIKAINRLVLITGLGGALTTIVLSPWLSEWLFNSNSYTISFVLLSSVVLLTGIYTGNYATLQGTRSLKLLANANIFGAIAGFLCSLPMFYFFREEGIVWAIILSAISTTIISLLYFKKVNLVHINQTYKETFKIGLSTLKLGIMMSLSGIASSLIQFGLKAFIAKTGTLNEVGLYEAGWVINASYLGLVFTAMSRDFFPRLSQNVNDHKIVKSILNQQIEITLLILAPMIIAMVVFLPFIIQLFYSSEFLGTVAMTKWILIGSLIKAGSWGISYIFLAKGDGKQYLINELGISVFFFPLYLIFYNLFGLVGIGYAFTIGYIIYFILVLFVAWEKYKIGYSYHFWKIMFIFSTALLLFPLVEILWATNYFIGFAFVIAVSTYSIYELNKRIDIKALLTNKGK